MTTFCHSSDSTFELSFKPQTKNKLGNTEIRTELVNTVREELLHFFNRNKDIATKIVEKVTDTQQLRVLAHGHYCRR